MSGVECRLAVFAANGDRLGLLPYPVDVQVSLPFCDVPSLKFDYSVFFRICSLAVLWTLV